MNKDTITIEELLNTYVDIEKELIDSKKKLNLDDCVVIGDKIKSLMKPTELFLLDAVKGSLAKCINNNKQLSVTFNFDDLNELFTIVTKGVILDESVTVNEFNDVFHNSIKENMEDKKLKTIRLCLDLFGKLFDIRELMFFLNIFNIYTITTNRYALTVSKCKQKEHDEIEK